VQYSVTGYGDTQVPYSMSMEVYVMQPDYETVHKAQELMDRKSHSYLGVVHLADAILEAPDARLRNLYRAKNAKEKEMLVKLAPFLDSVPKLVDVNPDAARPDEDLSRVLRAAVQIGRKTSQPAGPAELLVSLMRFAEDRRVAKIFEDALGSAEVVETWLADPMSAAAAAEIRTLIGQIA
jgi:ATP-dependent Clp protease ATP-binding subunit ClpB